jgi:hypothetical protein
MNYNPTPKHFLTICFLSEARERESVCVTKTNLHGICARTLSFDLLDIFFAIADSGSIANGARLVGISPSLASRKLTGIEDRLAVRLFTRSTRRLRLTSAGVLLLE